ncbi:Pigh [Symbiodinium necroappetens]|uniref:Pigh protein n=1 Tax=Symbiodinium necroappetens TaxID=1628268 RepID=A0A813BUL5_9DINO|nr:Pigh [Symbiodinium necroappetens]
MPVRFRAEPLVAGVARFVAEAAEDKGTSQPASLGRLIWSFGIPALLGSVACWRTAAAATALLLVLRATRARQVVEEVAVGIEGLGLQLSTRRSGGSIASDFISASSIQDIIIAEAVTFWDVFYYLVVEIKGSERTKVPFQHLRPLGRTF